ncbi:arylamine N-acetyltransferase [Vibrio sp. SM6]|uniref:Arylamine N-acetyltransferase n=1 Tax=Vibrio agarilyticus TaxID=2726741 RepID=A0A7X8YFN6_9VIBR|nr:arylamine N-acetyltransferase [Vibrio agarilyticus]NLS11531.1 arylamine N-acetyltransferase [Vibrio agarilyticus]
MDVSQFLARIQYQSKVVHSVACLDELQLHFIKHVPFENIDIINKTPLNYYPEAAFEKIVTHQRGGVCFELNSLFYWALSQLGFDVTLVEAEMFPGEHMKHQFDHMALLVNVEQGLYLVDVGNGKHFGAPLNVALGGESIGEGVRYKVADYHGNYHALCWFEDRDWHYRYVFREIPRNLADFQAASHFTQTSPDSPFTQTLLATKLADFGRLTLSGNTLTTTDTDFKQHKVTIPDNDIEAILMKRFGLNVTLTPSS